MPRPYNLILGEGRFKGIGVIPNDGIVYLKPQGSGFFDNTTMYGPPRDPSVPVPIVDDSLQTQLDNINAYLYSQVDSNSYVPSVAVSNNGLMDWVQKNASMLLVGSVIGLIIFRRN